MFFENKRKTNLETDDETCPKRQLFNKTNKTGITKIADKGAMCEASTEIKSHWLGIPLFIILYHTSELFYYLVISSAVTSL